MRGPGAAGLLVRPASVAALAAGCGVGEVGLVPDAETESIRGLLKQPPTVDATLTLPASQSS
jgi:hypothetical protein